MKKRKRFWAVLLAASTMMSGIIIPTSNVKAELKEQDTEDEPITPAVVEAELPEADGEYVIYMEDSRPNEVSFVDDTYELSGSNSEETVLEADLSQNQLNQLEELSGQEEIYVEENIFLTGAAQEAEERDINWDELELSEKMNIKKMLR